MPMPGTVSASITESAKHYDPGCEGVLNRSLYIRMANLAREAGLGSVGIINPGEQMSGSNVSLGDGSFRYQVSHWGETYIMNCLFCNDTKRRLYLPHRYGIPDPANPSRRGDFFGTCFNENCLDDPQNRERLYDRLFGLKARVAPAPQVDLNRGVPRQGGLVECSLPGRCPLLEELPQGHPAVLHFVSERRFSLGVASRYGVRFCEEAAPGLEMAQGRIIIPVEYQGRLVGWQGRLPSYQPAKGGPPKYYTRPGMPKGQLLYNYDRAAPLPFVVVFEGVTNVWRLGDYSVASFGDRISEPQRTLLQSTWDGRPILFCMDDEQAYSHVEATIQRIIDAGRNDVVRLRMPHGMDAADLDRDPLWRLIYHQAFQAGVRLPEVDLRRYAATL